MSNLNSYSEPVRKLYEKMNPCNLCPRNCEVYRNKGQRGYCGIAEEPMVSTIGPHFGEESVLVGTGGSGTIFFAGCNLKCVFCQNYDISHYLYGNQLSIEQLADAMVQLEDRGCSNINLVTPTHLAAPIAAAIEQAKGKGLSVPIVYNTGGYDCVETLKLLAGYIDIYMPDMKYSDLKAAKQLSDAPDYPQVNRDAVKEMHRQVGDLSIKKGIAKRGLLVRHLVLPNRLAGSFKIIDFLAEEISPSTYINVMGQYHPCYKAVEYSQINRRPYKNEIAEAVKYANEKGLKIA